MHLRVWVQTVRANSKDEGPLTYTQVLKFVPLVSPPGEQAPGSTYPRDHGKVDTGLTSCYPPRDLENVNLKLGKEENLAYVAPCLRQWTAYVPLDQTALRRPVATLEVSCY